MNLVLTALKNIPLIRHGDNLADILLAALRASQISLADGDIIVLAQKIVSKAEGRLVNLAAVTPSAEAVKLAAQAEKDARVVELILRESREVLRVRAGAIIVEHKLGFVCANAGIDHSNVAGDGNANEEFVLLLPENPDRSASQIRAALEAASGAHIGVLS